MINSLTKGFGKGLVAIVAAALISGGCSKSNPVSNNNYLSNNRNALLEMRLDANQDSSYVKAKVYASEPCSVGVDILDGNSVIASKEGYVRDSAVFRFDNLKNPLDGAARAYNNDTIWSYFIFNKEIGPGIGDTNGTFDPRLIENTDTSTSNNNLHPIDTNYVVPDTQDVSLPDTLHTDSLISIIPADTSFVDTLTHDPGDSLGQGGF